MKISPSIARIINVQIQDINGTKLATASCPFCHSHITINVGDPITCRTIGGCPMRFSAFADDTVKRAKEDHIVIDCISFSIEMKAELKSKPIQKIEEDGISRPIIKGMGTKKAFRIMNNYSKETSSILSYKGKPFEMKFDSLLELDFNDKEKIIKKIETYLLFS